jgi:hypothetical protein
MVPTHIGAGRSLLSLQIFLPETSSQIHSEITFFQLLAQLSQHIKVAITGAAMKLKRRNADGGAERQVRKPLWPFKLERVLVEVRRSSDKGGGMVRVQSC